MRLKEFVMLCFVCVVATFLAVFLVLDSKVLSVDSIEKIASVVHAQPRVLKAGQYWRMDKGSDPFKPRDYTAHIVAIKGGWVKYYFKGQETYGEWATQTSTVDDFTRVFDIPASP